MKIAFYTLGCKVNQYETQAMEQLLVQKGHTIGAFDERCDAYVVNTCTVTAVGDKKSRNLLRRARKLNEKAVIGVCGCYAQVSPDEVQALDVDVIGGTGDRQGFLEDLLRACEHRARYARLDAARERRGFEVLPAGGLQTRTRAMLKVEDGCDNFCSYCIIPYARGPVRSLPLLQALQQAAQLQQAGYREAVVTGIEISSWGRDLPGKPPLHALISSLCQAAPSMRFRLGSLEPRTVTEDFCRALYGLANLCPQFHLSLQSGCDGTLRRMNRRYDTARYLQSVLLLRRYFPGCAVTTDLIVGFPGETEQDFSDSLAFLRAVGFCQVHVFPYSRRTGTRAASMPGQIPRAEKESRAQRAGQCAQALSEAFRRSMLGTVVPVLFEQDAEGGFSVGHAPNGVLVYLPRPGLHNVLRSVRLTALHADGLLGADTDGPARG